MKAGDSVYQSGHLPCWCSIVSLLTTALVVLFGLVCRVQAQSVLLGSSATSGQVIGYALSRNGGSLQVESIGSVVNIKREGTIYGDFLASAGLELLRVRRASHDTFVFSSVSSDGVRVVRRLRLSSKVGKLYYVVSGFNVGRDGSDDLAIVDASGARYRWFIIENPLLKTASERESFQMGFAGDRVEWGISKTGEVELAALRQTSDKSRTRLLLRSATGGKTRVLRFRWTEPRGVLIPIRVKASRTFHSSVGMYSPAKRSILMFAGDKEIVAYGLPQQRCGGFQAISAVRTDGVVSAIELCDSGDFFVTESRHEEGAKVDSVVSTGTLPEPLRQVRRGDQTRVLDKLGEVPVPVAEPGSDGGSVVNPAPTPAKATNPTPIASPTQTATFSATPTETPIPIPPTDTPTCTPADTPTSTPSATPTTTFSADASASNPRNVGASLGRDSDVRIIWEVPVYGMAPSEYVIFRSSSGPPSTETTPLATVSGYEYVDTSVMNGTTYYYRVVSRFPDGSISSGVVVEGKALSPSAARDPALLFVASGIAAGGDGSIGNPYHSIASAIADVNPSGTVVLLPGTYNLGSSITVDKAITVRSQQGAYEESGGTILRGPNSFENSSWTAHFEVFLVTADGATISGLTFTQFSLAAPNTNTSAMITHGAVASPIKNLTIHNNRFIKNRANVTSSMSFSAARDQQTGWRVTSNYVGLMPASSNSILAHFWKDCQIEDNIIINSNFAGVQTLDISNCSITRNLVVNSTAYSIRLGCGYNWPCDNISITKNVLIGAIATAYSGAMRLSPNVVGTLTVSDNVIQNTVKSAVYFDPGGSFDSFSFQFKRNRLENSDGNALLISTTSGNVDATQNWWGSSSGPNVGGDPDSETISAGSSTVNSSAYLTSVPQPRFSGGKRLVSIAIAGWTTAPRGTKQLNAVGTFSDASVADVSELAIWYSSDSSVVSVNDTNDKGQATALRAGSATITAIVDGVIGTSSVTVNAATILAQLGDTNGGYQKINPATGALIGSLFVSGRSVLRGMLSFPGGFISLGCATPYRTEFFNYSGGVPSSPLIVQDVTNCPHGVSQTWDGKLLVADYDTYRINLHDGESGALISHFATGDLTYPFRAVELDDRRIIAGSWAGKLVAYSRYGGMITKIGDFATGLNQVWGLDYCARDNRILVSEYGNRRVSSCTASGVCSVLANHGKSGPLALRIDRNAGDCSFFLTFKDGEIRRYAADGTPVASPLADLPQQIFDLDFEWPAD